jgi:hypothetical protein
MLRHKLSRFRSHDGGDIILPARLLVYGQPMCFDYRPFLMGFPRSAYIVERS